MPVAFGFSAGDLISAIQLVSNVIDALRSAGNAAVQYRELLAQLLSLETALLKVNQLEFDDSQYQEVVALRQAAAQCCRTIDEFWKKAQKYQPSLNGNSSGSRIKDGWAKVKWALFKKDDVARFKADLVGHTESIQIFLLMVQRREVAIGQKMAAENQKTLMGEIQERFFSCMRSLAALAGQTQKLLAATAKILDINIKIFHIVLQTQRLITQMPRQIERQQPVYLIDALGRASPFHLEFIRSAEALLNVLKVNFRKHGKGDEKIERGEFAIEDVATKKDIDLGADWETCFAPGQRVNMSMIFFERKPFGTHSLTTCPKCEHHMPENGRSISEYVECERCGMLFQTTVRLQIGKKETALPRTSLVHESDRALSNLSPTHEEHGIDRKEVSLFRRVRLQISQISSSERQTNIESKSEDEKERVSSSERQTNIESKSEDVKERVSSSFSTSGWWICSECSREVPSPWGDACPDCGHSKCVHCDDL